jgi:SecD/SecF fusion protein
VGQESIDNSYRAGLIGFAAVVLFLLVFYRLPGLVASMALALYVVIVLGYFSLMNATLTLPGIAGFLLSIGMAIDGNIIIFERLKEEIRWGKTLHAAIEAAFSRAWVAILDGNVTTMLGALVLFFLGTGAVKGFATTLFIGNLAALFSAVFVTRQFMEIAVKLVPSLGAYTATTKPLPVPSVQLREGQYIRFVERSPLWVGISVAAMLVGVVFVFLNQGAIGKPLNTGIDFTGGEKLLLVSKEPFPIEGQELPRIVEKYSDGEATVQVDAQDPTKVSIRMRVKASGETEAELSRNRTENLTEMKKEIGAAFGGYVAEGGTEAANPRSLEESFVGPTIGKQLLQNAIWALIIGSLLVMFYIFIRFGDWAMSIGAIGSMLHNVIITLAFTAALRLEVNSSFIAVILTVIGYSINDAVIILDRVRENLRAFPASTDFRQLCNLSLTQTYLRSIATVLNVVIMIVAMLIFGGHNVKDFMLAMLVGMVSAGYSSIYIATPIILWLTKGRSPRSGAGAGAATTTLATAGAGGPGGTTIEAEREVYRSPGGAGTGEDPSKSGGKKQRRR